MINTGLVIHPENYLHKELIVYGILKEFSNSETVDCQLLNRTIKLLIVIMFDFHFSSQQFNVFQSEHEKID